MPTYRYRCKDCSSRFKVQATIREMEEGEAVKFACPSCRSRSVKKIFSLGNFFGNIFAKEKKCCCEGGSCSSIPKIEKKSCCDSSSCR